MIENVVPIVIAAKHLFEREHHPLLKDLLCCLKELMQVREREVVCVELVKGRKYGMPLPLPPPSVCVCVSIVGPHEMLLSVVQVLWWAGVILDEKLPSFFFFLFMCPFKFSAKKFFTYCGCSTLITP